VTMDQSPPDIIHLAYRILNFNAIYKNYSMGVNSHEMHDQYIIESHPTNSTFITVGKSKKPNYS